MKYNNDITGFIIGIYDDITAICWSPVEIPQVPQILKSNTCQILKCCFNRTVGVFRMNLCYENDE